MNARYTFLLEGRESTFLKRGDRKEGRSFIKWKDKTLGNYG